MNTAQKQHERRLLEWRIANRAAQGLPPLWVLPKEPGALRPVQRPKAVILALTEPTALDREFERVRKAAVARAASEEAAEVKKRALLDEGNAAAASILEAFRNR